MIYVYIIYMNLDPDSFHELASRSLGVVLTVFAIFCSSHQLLSMRSLHVSYQVVFSPPDLVEKYPSSHNHGSGKWFPPIL